MAIATINPFTGQPFANGQLPFVHPIGAAIAALYPLPNRDLPLANYVASPTLADDVDQFDVRMDHTLGAGSRLTGRYSFSACHGRRPSLICSGKREGSAAARNASIVSRPAV